MAQGRGEVALLLGLSLPKRTTQSPERSGPGERTVSVATKNYLVWPIGDHASNVDLARYEPGQHPTQAVHWVPCPGGGRGR